MMPGRGEYGEDSAVPAELAAGEIALRGCQIRASRQRREIWHSPPTSGSPRFGDALAGLAPVPGRCRKPYEAKIFPRKGCGSESVLADTGGGAGRCRQVVKSLGQTSIKASSGKLKGAAGQRNRRRGIARRKAPPPARAPGQLPN